MTKERTLPCLNTKIKPLLDLNKNILVSAHGNSLRSIIMSIEGLTESEILNFELQTGTPRIYEYKEGKFSLEKSKRRVPGLFIRALGIPCRCRAHCVNNLYSPCQTQKRSGFLRLIHKNPLWVVL